MTTTTCEECGGKGTVTYPTNPAPIGGTSDTMARFVTRPCSSCADTPTPDWAAIVRELAVEAFEWGSTADHESLIGAATEIERLQAEAIAMQSTIEIANAHIEMLKLLARHSDD